jgi:hypothetical protein
MADKVWIALEDTDHEESKLLGVFSTKEKAIGKCERDQEQSLKSGYVESPMDWKKTKGYETYTCRLGKSLKHGIKRNWRGYTVYETEVDSEDE